MRTIHYFDSEMTIEDYVKKEICKNDGGQSVAFKDDLIRLCESHKIPYKKKMSKDVLFDLLIENEISHKSLAASFSVGVSSQTYQKAFGISHNDVKRLEKHGELEVVGTYRYRAFGKYLYAPVYDIYQYGKMTDDDMRILLEKYPGRKKKEVE